MAFLITKELIFGFQILDLKDQFLASLISTMLLFLSDINWLTADQPRGGMLTFIKGLRTRVFSGKLSGVLQYNKTATTSHYE